MPASGRRGFLPERGRGGGGSTVAAVDNSVNRGERKSGGALMNRTIARTGAILGVLALAVGACSGAASPNPSVAAASAAPLKKVAFQIEWVPQAQFAGFYV